MSEKKSAAFEFPKVTEVQLVHVNVRRELHGESHVPAMDLSLRKEGSNELLDLLDLALRQALYYNQAATAGQEGLPEVLSILPNLRVPKLNGQKFNWAKGERHKGYRFVLDYGLGDEESNVDLDGCTVTGWNFETKEGGTVVLNWTVQYAGEKLTSEVRGKLTGLTDEPIHIQLFAPDVPQIARGKATAPAHPDGGGDGGDGGSGEGLFEGGGEGGQDGTDDDDDDTSGNPADPLAAMKLAHGVGESATT